jgi:hypothetical protein
MHAEQAPLEAPKLNLPPELLLALDRHAPERKTDLHLEVWNKPPFFKRLLARLLGK